MDPRIEQHLQDFVNDMQTFVLAGLEERMHKQALQVEQSCYDRHSGNIDKFSTCMSEKSKNMTKQTQRFETKVNFFTRSLVECLQKQESESGFSNCKVESKAAFKQGVDEVFDSLR